MSDTPRSINASQTHSMDEEGWEHCVPLEFARQLERELAEVYTSIPQLIREATRDLERKLIEMKEKKFMHDLAATLEPAPREETTYTGPCIGGSSRPKESRVEDGEPPSVAAPTYICDWCGATNHKKP
jgi:hypothetical protein